MVPTGGLVVLTPSELAGRIGQTRVGIITVEHLRSLCTEVQWAAVVEWWPTIWEDCEPME